MELRDIAVFVQAVEDGDFSTAARTLSLTPSAVSKSITRLEDQLGRRLLHRSSRAMRLTPEGQGFLDAAQRVLDAVEEAEAVGYAKDGAKAGQKGAPLSRGGVPGSAENVPHHRNGNALMDDRQHQDIDVVAAKLPTRAVEGQKPRPRSNACDPDDHSGELASVYDDLFEEALETAVV